MAGRLVTSQSRTANLFTCSLSQNIRARVWAGVSGWVNECGARVGVTNRRRDGVRVGVRARVWDGVSGKVGVWDGVRVNVRGRVGVTEWGNHGVSIGVWDGVSGGLYECGVGIGWVWVRIRGRDGEFLWGL